ncbi:MAG: hypothetical protein P4M07_25095 [Xanthobacteraceae bacterium]|nr:hypothetical protein [Xanthobacteraceae bacterium]
MPPTSPNPSCQMPQGIHPLLRGIAVEGRAVAVRLLAYVCGLAMLALIAADLMATAVQQVQDQQAQDQTSSAGAPVPGWSRASRPDRAFAVAAADFPAKTETYETWRRPDGSRRDVLRWIGDGGEPVAELTVERAGSLGFVPLAAAVAPQTGAASAELEPAGLVRSKFGSVELWRVAGGAPSCLGFAKDVTSPRLRISGWTCAAQTRNPPPVLIGCALDRLTLLSAGNNPELAALFARAELKRGGCGTSLAADWVTEPAPPRLRGRL